MLSLHIQNDYYGSNDRNHKAIKIEKQTNGDGYWKHLSEQSGLII